MEGNPHRIPRPETGAWVNFKSHQGQNGAHPASPRKQGAWSSKQVHHLPKGRGALVAPRARGVELRNYHEMPAGARRRQAIAPRAGAWVRRLLGRRFPARSLEASPPGQAGGVGTGSRGSGSGPRPAGRACNPQGKQRAMGASTHGGTLCPRPWHRPETGGVGSSSRWGASQTEQP